MGTSTFFRKPENFWEILRKSKNSEKFWKYFRKSENISENLKKSEKPGKWDFPAPKTAWLTSHMCKHDSPEGTCCSGVHWRFYNCVSRGHSAIIGRTQIKKSGHKLKLADWPGGCGPPVAEHKARETVGIPLSMERSARRECAVFDGEMKTKDWFCCCKLCIFLNLPISAILVG